MREPLNSSVQRAIRRTRVGVRNVRAVQSGQLGEDRLASQWNNYKKLAPHDQTAWVAQRTQVQGVTLAEEKTRYEQAMAKRFS